MGGTLHADARTEAAQDVIPRVDGGDSAVATDAVEAGDSAARDTRPTDAGDGPAGDAADGAGRDTRPTDAGDGPASDATDGGAQPDADARPLCACPRGQIACRDRCVDPRSDHDHCGASPGCGVGSGSTGQRCAPGESCASGHCEACLPLPAAADQSYAVPGSDEVTAADLDRDGRPDLVTAHNGIFRVMNDGTGQLLPGAMIGTADDTTDGNVAVGDLDEDGAPDLVVARLFGSAGPASRYDGAAVRRGAGDGTFPGPWQSIDPAGYWRVALGDFDEDGHLDLVGNSVDLSMPYLVLRRGAGDGTFGPPIALPPANLFAAGDANGDGHLDLFVGGVGGIDLLLGDGTGDLTRRLVGPAVGDPLLGTFKASVGDLDGDGILDLAVSYTYAGNVAAWSGNGDGSYREEHDLVAAPSLNVTRVYDTAIADLDGDGRGELLVFRPLSTSASVLDVLPVGRDGRFNDALLPIAGATALLAGDFDGDGDADLVSANEQFFQLHTNRGDGSLVHRAPQSAVGAFFLAGAFAGDFDGDGIVDLLVAGSGVGAQILFGTPDGLFDRWGPAFSFSTYGTPRGVFDLDGDGALDLLTMVQSGSSARLLAVYGRGDGSFLAPVVLSNTVDPSVTSLAVADFNLDCHPDVFLHMPTNPVAAILTAPGQPGLSVWLAGLLIGDPIVVGDFTSDGQPDLAYGVELNTAGRDPRPIGPSVLPGMGDGSFAGPLTTATISGLDSSMRLAPAIGDLDGDGALDLIFQNPPRLLRGDGHGGFAPLDAAPPPGAEPSVTAVADFNGDGRLDVAFAGATTGAITVVGTCR